MFIQIGLYMCFIVEMILVIIILFYFILLYIFFGEPNFMTINNSNALPLTLLLQSSTALLRTSPLGL